MMPKHPLTRRTALKIIAGGTAALYLRPFSMVSAEEFKTKLSFADFSPIDRSLPEKSERHFYADDPTRAHEILWDKQGFLKKSGGQLPQATEKVPLVVIGGGMSGLFSAYLLRSHNPVILEQAPRFGGNAKGQSFRGIDYSIGAAYFIEPEEDSEIGKLCQELGLDALWKVKEEEDPVSINDKIYKSFWTGETSPKEKAQFEKLAAYFEAVNEGDGEYAYPDIPIVDEEQRKYIVDLDSLNFKAHLEKIVGGKLHPHIETAIEQYCWSSFGASSTEISAASGVNFYASEFGNIILFPGGNSAIAEHLLQKLDKTLPQGNLRPSSLVFDVAVLPEGVQVAYVDSSGTLKTIFAQSVVMACPKFVVKKILQDIEPERLSAIEKLRYHSYLVANVCLSGKHGEAFYDLYMLGDGKVDTANVQKAATKRQVTDVIMADYAKLSETDTVLTLYRGMPFDGARPELYAPDAFEKFAKQFETQIRDEILPLLQLKKENIVDLRIARWGHPLPVAAQGLIANGVVEKLREPFRERVFFVEQDNWALPAFETAVTEALLWSEKVDAYLRKTKAPV